MTDLEMLCQMAHDRGLRVVWKPLSPVTKGLIRGDLIILRKEMTSAEAADTLAEEIAHDMLTVGDITDQTDAGSRQQEQRARLMAYDMRIGLDGIIECYKAHCKNSFQMAELLGVSEEFLVDALEHYRSKYGRSVKRGDYLIFFEPQLAVMEFK